MKNRTPEGFTSGQWAAVIQGLESRPSTVNDYRKVLNLLHSYDQGIYHIGTMTKEDAESYFRYLDSRQAEGTLSENTVHRYKATLRSLGARIEARQDIWPGYANPFSRLVTNENRKRTEYRADMFASAEDMRKVREVLPRLAPEEQLILTFMMNLGLSPAQIQNLHISSFSVSPDDSRSLILNVDEGNFIEQSSLSWKESPYYIEGYPIRFVRKIPNRSITWNYTGSYIFTPEFADQLRSYYEYIGVSTDTRAFFLTVRHLEFNYRAMHHMVLNVCELAGLETKLTPNMISRHGMIHSYLLDKAQHERADLEAKLASASPEEKPAIEAAIAENEANFTRLSANGWIGGWKDRFPIPLKERVDSMINYLGEDFLLHTAGLK